MIVNEVMSKTSTRYYESDIISDVIKRLLEMEEEGGLVYDALDKLIGYFTYKELLVGNVTKNIILRDIIVRDFFLVEEDTSITKIDFAKNELLPVIDNDGKVTGFITKNKYLTAIAEINQNDCNRLSAILNSVHNGVLSIDVEGRITFMNSPAEKMALTTREKSIGKFLNDVVTPSGLLNVIRTGKGHSERYKVGNRMYIAHRSPIYNHKKLVGAVGVFQDISEVEFISNELDSFKQLINELDTVIHSSSDGICVVAPSGNIIRKNEKFNELYFGDLTEENKRNDFFNMINSVVEKGSCNTALEKNNISGNSLMISTIPVKNSSEVVERVLVRVQDMTETEELQRELERVRFFLKTTQEGKSDKEFVAVSEVMKSIVAKVDLVAQVDVSVLISGESGVGKNELAKLIKNSSFRKSKALVKVDCSAISTELMERELFGYVSDSQSSDTGKAGVFDHADGGTIFLDGIDKMPLQSQAKLLQVLQEQSITKVGSTESKKIDVRIIAATNENLQDLVNAGKFREDLFYKINVVSLVIPPLRERKEDIPEFVKVYVDQFSKSYKKNIRITEEAMQSMMSNHWQGNVRELVNYIERIFVISSEENITVKDLDYIFNEGEQLKAAQQKPIIVNKIMPLKEAVEELERELIALVGKNENSFRKIAKILEVNPSTIARKVKRLEEG